MDNKKRFYSGISFDQTEFLINMNFYSDELVAAVFRRSSLFRNMDKTHYILPDDYELVYYTFKWDGETYYPEISDEEHGEPIRRYKIYKKMEN